MRRRADRERLLAVLPPDALTDRDDTWPCHAVVMRRYEYRVLELREKMIGGKMSGDKLERILNEQAAEGWQLRTITSAEIKGRLGPGGVEGLLVTFERALES